MVSGGTESPEQFRSRSSRLSSRCLLVRARAEGTQLLRGRNAVRLWKGLHGGAACSVRGLHSLIQMSSQSQRLNSLNQPLFPQETMKNSARENNGLFQSVSAENQPTSLQLSDKTCSNRPSKLTTSPSHLQTHQQPEAHRELPASQEFFTFFRLKGHRGPQGYCLPGLVPAPAAFSTGSHASLALCC